MDSASFKTLTTSRGFKYHYYHSPTQDPSLPTLLFLHDFPATSLVWRYQVVFFCAQGFRLIVPDMLGFGGSSKPTDPGMYTPSLVCQDIVDIMDMEQIGQAIAIGHGLGSKIVSRLASFHETRFLGFAFLAVPYAAPRPRYTVEFTLYATKRMCGYELCGHTLFFAESSSPKIIESHLVSFFSAMFPDDPKMWVTQVAPIGALKAWLEADKTTPVPSYLTSVDTQAWQDAFANESFEAPLCWYKALVSGINADDDKCEHLFRHYSILMQTRQLSPRMPPPSPSSSNHKAIPLDKYIIEKPVFFGAARHDYISRSVLGIATTNYHCRDASIREFSAGHWLMLSNHVEVNRALLSWIMDLV